MIAPRLLSMALLASLVFVGCQAVSPVRLSEKPPIDADPIRIGDGEQRVTEHVVIVTDASGTMYVNETFPSAKALTRSFVSAMPEASAPAKSSTYTAGAIGFGGDERNTAPQSSFDRARLASQAQSLEIMGSVDGMGGPTPLDAVIVEAAGALEGKSGRAALVVFSDGLPDDPARTLGVASTLVEGRSGETCIHAVQTGTSQEGYAFLKSLTELSRCGSLRNEDDLTSGYEVQQLAKSVFVGPGVAAVAAAGPCEGVVRLRGIEFEFDQDRITEASKPVLDVAVERLNECPEIGITITGHTDAIGTEAYNNGLSYRRAEATRRYFIEKGISAGRLDAEGLGESQPIAPNDSAQGRAQNRRVELAPSR